MGSVGLMVPGGNVVVARVVVVVASSLPAVWSADASLPRSSLPGPVAVSSPSVFWRMTPRTSRVTTATTRAVSTGRVEFRGGAPSVVPPARDLARWRSSMTGGGWVIGRMAARGAKRS
jgi:hypothetical protein